MPLISGPAKRANPVTLPPGRPRLATRPDRTGSGPLVAMTITIGIVVVACFAAMAAVSTAARMTSTLRRTSSIARGRESIEVPLRPSILDQDVLTLNPTELAEPLPECVAQVRRRLGTRRGEKLVVTGSNRRHRDFQVSSSIARGDRPRRPTIRTDPRLSRWMLGRVALGRVAVDGLAQAA